MHIITLYNTEANQYIYVYIYMYWYVCIYVFVWIWLGRGINVDCEERNWLLFQLEKLTFLWILLVFYIFFFFFNGRERGRGLLSFWFDWNFWFVIWLFREFFWDLFCIELVILIENWLFIYFNYFIYFLGCFCIVVMNWDYLLDKFMGDFVIFIFRMNFLILEKIFEVGIKFFSTFFFFFFFD